MPMQIGLEDLLSMLVSRVDEISIDNENSKSRFNIMFRMLYKKGLFTENDAVDAIKDENKILLELGLIKQMPDDDTIIAAAKSLMLWIKGDAQEIRRSMDELQKRIQAENQKRSAPKIETAPAGVLDELDRLGGNNAKKLIL